MNNAKNTKAQRMTDTERFRRALQIYGRREAELKAEADRIVPASQAARARAARRMTRAVERRNEAHDRVMELYGSAG